MHRRRRSRGFTLIEVLLVVGILAALATVAIVALWPAQSSSEKNLTAIKVGQVKDAIMRYKMDTKVWPESGEAGIQALLSKPSEDIKGWNGPYVDPDPKWGGAPRDEWGNLIQYELSTDENNNQIPHVWSSGLNGNSGDDDDIRSWTESQ